MWTRGQQRKQAAKDRAQAQKEKAEEEKRKEVEPGHKQTMRKGKGKGKEKGKGPTAVPTGTLWKLLGGEDLQPKLDLFEIPPSKLIPGPKILSLQGATPGLLPLDYEWAGPLTMVSLKIKTIFWN